MIELTVICALIVLITVQHFFWSMQVQKLVDKLMSRNYGEYQQMSNMNLETPNSSPAPEAFNLAEHEDLRAIGG